MSDHNPGSELNLDDIEERCLDALGDQVYFTPRVLVRESVPALVAEVRRLREERAAIDVMDWPGEAHRLQAALHFARGTIDDLSRTVERLETEATE